MSRRPTAAQRGYSSDWARLAARLARRARRDGVACRLCGHLLDDGSRLVVHHILSRREHPELALEESNLEVLHQRCHTAHHKREDLARERGYGLACGLDGYPTDEGHPFNVGRAWCSRCKGLGVVPTRTHVRPCPACSAAPEEKL